MNNFWEWMEERGYGEHNHIHKEWEEWVEDAEDNLIRPTKQMLIGYMMEYVREKSEKGSIDIIYDYYVKTCSKDSCS